jgi:DNA-binding NarL/FixJ family response regulator
MKGNPANLRGAPPRRPSEGSQRRDRIPLLLVDSNASTRQSLAHVLMLNAHDFEVQSIARLADAVAQKPRLALLNIGPARLGGHEVVKQLAGLRRKLGENVPLVVLAERDDGGSVLEAIRRGLRGYIPIYTNVITIVAAIRVMLAGATFVPPVTNRAERIVRGRNQGRRVGLARGRPVRHASVVSFLGLTSREVEVFERLQRGKANKVIAFELKMSERTIEVHVRRIRRKLNATKRTQLALAAPQPPK